MGTTGGRVMTETEADSDVSAVALCIKRKRKMSSAVGVQFFTQNSEGVSLAQYKKSTSLVA